MTEPLPIADHRRAIAIFGDVLAAVAPADLTRPTPCTGWAVGDLLAHQYGQDLAFTAALGGGAAGVADWAPVPVGSDVPGPQLAALQAQQRALSAFGDPEGRVIWMPEILPSAPLPAARALSAHLLDLIVHSWDLGAAIGRMPAVDADLAEQCAAMSRSIPDGPERRQPNPVFAPGLAVPQDSGPLEETLLLLGRDPGWTPPPG